VTTRTEILGDRRSTLPPLSGAGARPARAALQEVARGERPADLVICGGTLVNVHTGERYPADVAVHGELIAAVGDVSAMIGPDTERVDATGMHLTPGLIDAHVHTYEMHLAVPHVAAAMLPHGVTTIATDFYGEAVVAGVPAVRASLDAARATPLNVLFTVPMPAYVQDRPYVHTGTIGDAEIAELLAWDDCIGIDECFAPLVAEGDPALLDLMERARAQRKALCGHGSETSGSALMGWAAVGGHLDDHECIAPEEVVEKARLGIRIVLREGSGVADVRNCLPAITEHGLDPRRFSFCSDLLSPVDLVREGDIDRCVRYAIEAGVDAVDAIRMGSLNAAETLRVDDRIGAVAPGKRADICLVAGELEDFAVRHVVAGGELVVRDGRYIGPQPRLDYPDFARDTIRLPKDPEAGDFAIATATASATTEARVIVVRDGSIVTAQEIVPLRVAGGAIQPDPARDVLKLASWERHGMTGKLGLGFVRGFGLTRGAMASSYNPHCQHLLAVGADDADMATAARAVRDMGGGFAVVAGGETLATVPLPLYGLLSERPADVLVKEIEAAIDAARSLGCGLSAPFHTLAFVGLPVVIGTLKICSEGLVDVWGQRIVGVEPDGVQTTTSPAPAASQ
jgi:adenine deaminase